MSTKNSGDNSGAGGLRPGPRGGKLLPGGKPGNRGGTGRPPNEFRGRMAKLASSSKAEAYLKRCLAGEFGPKYFLQAQAFVADRGYGRPTQAVEVSGPDGGPVESTLIVRFVGADADG
ncbi:MAG: hypothetical protein JWM27_4720 [Gemmatimonadetes bacterium]|nr:hypothetical protein [Gemmatimonadota bacterium]